VPFNFRGDEGLYCLDSLTGLEVPSPWTSDGYVLAVIERPYYEILCPSCAMSKDPMLVAVMLA
jgi:hypothetical protein